jgi:hypothetical protein
VETPIRSSTSYRVHDIGLNSSGRSDDARTSIFMILEPTANPMFISVLYEQAPYNVQIYDTDEQAYDAAMTQARAWLDAHLDASKGAS